MLRDCVVVAAFFIVWFSAYRYKELRLITAMLPFLAVLMALGVTEFVREYVRERWRMPVIGLTGILFAFLALGQLAARLDSSRTLGYPVFPRALAFVSSVSHPDDIIMGASEPQIHWYTGKRVAGFPSRDDLARRLEEVDWVIIVNFERGQPEYAARLLEGIGEEDISRAGGQVFMDRSNIAVVLPAAYVRTLVR